jgi:putative lipoprotein
MARIRTTLAGLAVGLGLSLGDAARAQESQAPSAAPAQQEHNNVKRAIRWRAFEYTCAGGATLSVYLGDSLAKVLYQNHQYVMKQTASADGNRYSDGKVVWWGKGNGGFLQEDAPNGNGKMIVEECKLNKPAETPSSVITGTVTYLQRMALPPNAVIDVKLEDVSQANAPAQVIVEQKLTLGNRQVPILYELKFDPAKVDARHSYALSATISLDGVTRFAHEQPYPVLTMGNTSHVDMVLQQVNGEGEKK